MNQASARAPPVPECERSSSAGKNCIAGGKDKRGIGEHTMSEPVAPNGPARRRARMQTWGLIGIALALYGVLRLVFGPLPQDPWYPILADARRCGPIPRAGDVLTNLSILAAGVVAALGAAASGH